MRWNSGTDGAACFFHLACPQVFQRIAAFLLWKSHGRRRYRDCLRLTPGVEQTDNYISVRFLFREYLSGAGIDNSFGRDRVLVNSEDSGVLQVLKVQWVEVSEVDAQEEG